MTSASSPGGLIERWIRHLRCATWPISWAHSRRKRIEHQRQVKNTVVGEIVTALKKELNILSEVRVLVSDVDPTRADPVIALNRFIEFTKTIGETTTPQWADPLEQYGVLFPEATRCLPELIRWSESLAIDLWAFFRELYVEETPRIARGTAAFDRRAAILQMAPSLLKRISAQGALLEDLLVHVQNFTVGEVGGKMPRPTPQDANALRIVLLNKHLTIVDSQGKAVELGAPIEKD